MKYIIIILMLITVKSTAQIDSSRSDTHIFWNDDFPIEMIDFRDTISNQNYQIKCDSLGLCWGACVGLFSVLDEPKKKRKRGKLLEIVYFAPAFEINKSYRLNKDSTDYLTQLLIFDVYELTARKCRKDLQHFYDQMPYYGTKYMQFKTVEDKNIEIMKDIIGSIVNDVYIEKKEGAYNDWRNIISDLLTETIEFKTTNKDRFRFISNKPLSRDYQMAKTVMGAMKN